MKNIKKVMFMCILTLGLYGCSNNEVKREEMEQAQQSTEIETTSDENSSTPDAVKSEDNNSSKRSDDTLEGELKKYRREREDNIVEVNGLVEASSPNEDNYSLDLSGLAYLSGLDTRETTEAYRAARIYVTDTLGIAPNTKMEVYTCVDPVILAIYEDEDKGVAEGYENSNIFVCEYCGADDVWQYLILVREGKGEAWQVIHSGKSYKE